jgi:hypothetical protein
MNITISFDKKSTYINGIESILLNDFTKLLSIFFNFYICILNRL